MPFLHWLAHHQCAEDQERQVMRKIINSWGSPGPRTYRPKMILIPFFGFVVVQRLPKNKGAIVELRTELVEKA